MPQNVGRDGIQPCSKRGCFEGPLYALHRPASILNDEAGLTAPDCHGEIPPETISYGHHSTALAGERTPHLPEVYPPSFQIHLLDSKLQQSGSPLERKQPQLHEQMQMRLLAGC